MSAFADFLPLLAFFIAYKLQGLNVAVATLMVATVLLMAGYRIAGKKVAKHMLMTSMAVLVFGGLTLAIDDPLFIKIKSTVVFSCMAVAIAVAHMLGRNPIAAIAGHSMPHVPQSAWRRVGWQWAAFFAVVAATNLILVFTVSEQAWVNFKVFGITALMFLFIIVQTVLLFRKYGSGDSNEDEREAPARPAS